MGLPTSCPYCFPLSHQQLQHDASQISQMPCCSPCLNALYALCLSEGTHNVTDYPIWHSSSSSLMSCSMMTPMSADHLQVARPVRLQWVLCCHQCTLQSAAAACPSPGLQGPSQQPPCPPQCMHMFPSPSCPNPPLASVLPLVTPPGCQQLQHGHPQVSQVPPGGTDIPALHALLVPLLCCLAVEEVGAQQLPDASIAQLGVELGVEEDVIRGRLAQQRLQSAATLSAFWLSRKLCLGSLISQQRLQGNLQCKPCCMLFGQPERCPLETPCTAATAENITALACSLGVQKESPEDTS